MGNCDTGEAMSSTYTVGVTWPSIINEDIEDHLGNEVQLQRVTYVG